MSRGFNPYGLSRHYTVSTRKRHDSAKRKRKVNRLHVAAKAKRRASWRA